MANSWSNAHHRNFIRQKLAAVARFKNFWFFLDFSRFDIKFWKISIFEKNPKIFKILRRATAASFCRTLLLWGSFDAVLAKVFRQNKIWWKSRLCARFWSRWNAMPAAEIRKIHRNTFFCCMRGLHRGTRKL